MVKKQYLCVCFTFPLYNLVSDFNSAKSIAHTSVHDICIAFNCFAIVFYEKKIVLPFILYEYDVFASGLRCES